MSHQEETSSKTQDTLEGLCLLAVLGTPWGPTRGAGEAREVKKSLLGLLPPPDPTPNKRAEDGWIGEKFKRLIG